MKEKKVFKIIEMLFTQNNQVRSFLVEALNIGVKVKKQILNSGAKIYETSADCAGRTRFLVLDEKGILSQKGESMTNQYGQTLVSIKIPGQSPKTIIYDNGADFVETVVNGGAIKDAFVTRSTEILDGVCIISPKQTPAYNKAVRFYEIDEIKFIDNTQRHMGNLHKPAYENLQTNYDRNLPTFHI